jgi:TolB protein
VFSADGRFIVYSSDQGELPFANLFTIPVSGGEPEQLTHYNGYDGAPSWSPDGQWIVFESSSGDPDEGGTALWLIRWTNSRASS